MVALIVTGQLLPFGRPKPRQQPGGGKPAVDHSALLRFVGASAPTPQPEKARTGCCRASTVALTQLSLRQSSATSRDPVITPAMNLIDGPIL